MTLTEAEREEWVRADGECPCGGDLYIDTSCGQDPDYEWCAHDGDWAICEECGAEGQIRFHTEIRFEPKPGLDSPPTA